MRLGHTSPAEPFSVIVTFRSNWHERLIIDKARTSGSLVFCKSRVLNQNRNCLFSSKALSKSNTSRRLQVIVSSHVFARKAYHYASSNVPESMAKKSSAARRLLQLHFSIHGTQDERSPITGKDEIYNPFHPFDKR